MKAKVLHTHPLSILLSAAIILLSLLPIPEMPKLEDVPLIDKWTHFVMYGALGIMLWFESLRQKGNMPKHQLFCLSVLYPILLGGLLELAQEYLTSCRSGEWLDFLADSIGVVIASLFGSTILRWLMKKGT